MATLRVAGIGAGYFSQFQYEAWQRLPEVDTVAIHNRTLAKAEAHARQYAIPAAFDDVERMLDEARPDLVDIITPPETHLAMIAACAQRRIPMVCQKPFTPSLEQAKQAMALAEAADVPLIIHENFRWQPWYRESRRIIDAGTLGDVYGVTFRLRPGDGQGPRAYLDRQPYFQAMPRFLVHETAIHLIDTFRFLVGEVTGVFARLRRLNPVIAGEDSGVIVFDFAGGATGVFDGNRLVDHAAQYRRLTMGEMWIEGSAAVLRLDGDGRLFLRRHGENDEQEVAYDWRDVGFGGDCIFDLQRHVVAHLRGDTPVENTARAYLRNLEIEEAVYRSAESGHREAL